MHSRLQSLLELFGQNADDAFVLYVIAQEYAKLGDLQKAVDFFNRLKSADPDYVGLYYHLGKLEQKLGHPEIARQVFANGKSVAKAAGDLHALSELERALKELEEGQS